MKFDTIVIIALIIALFNIFTNSKSEDTILKEKIELVEIAKKSNNQQLITDTQYEINEIMNKRQKDIEIQKYLDEQLCYSSLCIKRKAIVDYVTIMPATFIFIVLITRIRRNYYN